METNNNRLSGKAEDVSSGASAIVAVINVA